MKVIKFISIIAMLIGGTWAFPNFDPFHAHCEMTVEIEDSCHNTKRAIKKMVATTDPNLDPAEGFYHYKRATKSSVEVTRTGPG